MGKMDGMQMTDWQGDLNDDCTLERYGYMAHAEKMDKGHWWIAVCKSNSGVPYTDIYNTAENGAFIPLQTGEIARTCAEIVLECLRQVTDVKIDL